MTTKLIVKNAAVSNGDVHMTITCGGHAEPVTLTPGKQHEAWVATEHRVAISETWPTATPANDQVKMGEMADELIATEVAIQDKMWGDANDRADATNNQLMAAAMAQLVLTSAKVEGEPVDVALKLGASFYPQNWSGFRDYQSNIANLVVAAAFIRSEIKRRLLLGEDTTRSKRHPEQTYNPETGLPNVSAEEARTLQ